MVSEGSVYVTGDTDINNLDVAGVNSIEYFTVVFYIGKAKLRNIRDRVGTDLCTNHLKSEIS